MLNRLANRKSESGDAEQSAIRDPNSAMPSDSVFTRRMLQTVFAIAGVAILVISLWVAREAVLLVYISALIAMGFAPLVKLIERGRRDARRRIPRSLAILVVYLAVVIGFVIVGLVVIPPLVAQANALWARIPEEFDKVQNFLIRSHILRRRVTLAEAVQNAPNGSGAAVGTVLVALTSFAGGIFEVVTVLILSFYLLIEARTMFDYFIRFVPAGRRDEAGEAAHEVVEKVSAWLRAQVILAGVMGTFAAVGLGLLNVPYFYVVALIAAVGETIPILGPIIAGVTAVAIALTVSPQLALAVGVYFLVLHQLEANILVPKIMEKRVGVSPVAVMVALLIGGALWGVVGAILAIPTAAIGSVIIEDLAFRRDRLIPDSPA
ncbi:MAG TPA: AI-2E family transporter [Vicinamibacterales bacterium]